MKCNKCSSSSFIVLNSFGTFKCQKCSEKITTQNISKRTYCEKCSTELKKCERCGEDIIKRGKLLFIEAVDCAGKTTQVEMLKKEFGEERYRFYREPGGTKTSEMIRDVILESSNSASNYTQTLLFAAARSELYDQIEKDLNAGLNVICDRSYISSIVYQGDQLASDINRENIRKIKKLAPVFVLLDIDEETFLKRKNIRNGNEETSDGFEDNVIKNFNKYRRKYADAFKYSLILEETEIIDATDSIDEINKKLNKIIKQW